MPAPPPGIVIPLQAFRHVSAIRAYPYVMVDLPAPMHSSCRDILMLADAIYLISTPEVVALHLARRRVSELTELSVSPKNIHVIFNRAGSRKTLNVEDVADVVGAPVFETLANDYPTVSDAALKGNLISNDTPLGRQFTALAGQIAGVEGGQRPRGQIRSGACSHSFRSPRRRGSAGDWEETLHETLLDDQVGMGPD